MQSSRVITIFHQPPPSRRGPSSLVVSVGLHAAAFVWIYFGLRQPSTIHQPTVPRHFSVRLFRQDDIVYPVSRTQPTPAPEQAAQSTTPSDQPSAEPQPPQVATFNHPTPETAPKLAASRMATAAPQLTSAAMPTATPQPVATFNHSTPDIAPQLAASHLSATGPQLTSAQMPTATPQPVARFNHSTPETAPKLTAPQLAAAAPRLAPATMAVAAPQPAPPPDLNKMLAKTHTLIQPDVPQDVKLQQIVPLPTIVKWAPDNSHDKIVIMPTPAENTAALAKPTITSPNRELKPADVKISSTPFKTSAPVLPPSTTSPIVVRRAQPPSRVPETTAKASAPQTPVQIVSLSDLQSKQAVIPVPAANSAAQPTRSTTMATGKTESASAAASGSPAGKASASATATQGAAEKAQNGPAVSRAQNGSATGNNSGGAQAGSAANAAKPGSGAAGSRTEAAGAGTTGAGQTSAPGAGEKSTASGAERAGGGSTVAHNNGGAGVSPAPSASSGPGSDPLAIHVLQPKDGQFGVVVVGSTLAEQYPETVSFWSGRLIYTVYLHVGRGKSWILQYSIPRDGAVAGAVTKPDAPWPYDMVRPHLEPADFNSDAIMVHGFVNPTGHFDRLAVVFPDQFAKAKMVLNDLEQWQFRPAKQNGQIAAVEVLLIIPEETE